MFRKMRRFKQQLTKRVYRGVKKSAKKIEPPKEHLRKEFL